MRCLLASKADKKGTAREEALALILSDTSLQPDTSSNMLSSSSDYYDEYFVYPEDSQSFKRETEVTELPSKLDLMDGLRTLEFEASTTSTVLWSSDDRDLYLEDTDNAEYIENLPLYPLQTSSAARYRHPGFSSGGLLGVPQLSPDGSPFSVASSISPLTPDGGAPLPDLFYPSLGDFVPPDVMVDSRPFFEQHFMEDIVCPEQLQEDLACQAVLDVSSSASPSRSVSHSIPILPVGDAELAHGQSPLPRSVVGDDPSVGRSQFLNLSESLTEGVLPQMQRCVTPIPSACPPVQNQLSSLSTSRCLSTAPAETRRGIKRRRTNDDDDDYQPNRSNKRAASSYTRSNVVAPRKPRKGGPHSSKRAIRHEETKEERFECLMFIHGCTKSFTRKNDMERHLGSCKFDPDLRSMTVRCPRCQKTLSRKDALLRHIKQSHAEIQ